MAVREPGPVYRCFDQDSVLNIGKFCKNIRFLRRKEEEERRERRREEGKGKMKKEEGEPQQLIWCPGAHGSVRQQTNGDNKQDLV